MCLLFAFKAFSDLAVFLILQLSFGVLVSAIDPLHATSHHVTRRCIGGQ